MSFKVSALFQLSKEALRSEAKALGLSPVLSRTDALIYAIAKHHEPEVEGRFGQGVLEVHGEGFGFLRAAHSNFLPGSDDIYVSQSQIRRFHLQTGDTVLGLVREPKEGERYFALLRVECVNGDKPGERAPSFSRLTAIYPDDPIDLSGDPMLAVIDAVAPIGLGQRGLLVAPSRTKRTEVLRRLSETLTRDDDLEVTVLLIDEKPEEIEEWRRDTKAEVIATPFDETTARTLQVAETVFERARRMVERGDDVVLIVDSFDRLLRACQAELSSTGHAIGGIDVSALHRLRRFFGAARALEEGGSLTVLAVLSSDPSSSTHQTLVDDLQHVINWELHLSRPLADRGLHPAIDIARSGTQRVKRLLSPRKYDDYLQWRGALSHDPVDDLSQLITITQQLKLDTALQTGQ